jgi:hypothetical protein
MIFFNSSVGQSESWKVEKSQIGVEAHLEQLAVIFDWVIGYNHSTGRKSYAYK